MRADERLYSDTLLYHFAFMCWLLPSGECLWRRLIQFVNTTVMAYPWHEPSVLTVSEVPPPIFLQTLCMGYNSRFGL